MKKLVCIFLALVMLLPICASARGSEKPFGEPETVALSIGGSSIKNGKGFLRNFICLTEDDMDRIADSASGEITYRLGIGDSFSEPMTYSTFEDHGTPTWIYRCVCGLDLTELARALGVDVTQKMSITVSAPDGMSRTLTDGFGAETKRVFYDVYGNPGQVVGPVLALYETTSETESLGNGILPPIPKLGGGSEDRVNNVFGYGQTAVDEINSCYWVKCVNRLRFGTEDPALIIKNTAGRSQSLSISGIASMGVWNASFGTVYASGIPLSELFSASDVSIPDGYGIEAVSSSGSVFISDPDKVFIAWNAVDGGARVENSTPLRLYFTDGRVFGDLASISVQKAPDFPDVQEFSDLDGYDWARTAIEALHRDGIVNGMSDGEYVPGSHIRRADFVLMLCRAYGLHAAGSMPFADVPPEAYYAEAVSTARGLGIAEGDGVSFFPAADVSRQEAMVFICRTLKAIGRDMTSYSADLSVYSDSDLVAGWAESSVSVLVGAGIINGKGSILDPLGSLTRAEMAVALYRTLNL